MNTKTRMDRGRDILCNLLEIIFYTFDLMKTNVFFRIKSLYLIHILHDFDEHQTT